MNKWFSNINAMLISVTAIIFFMLFSNATLAIELKTTNESIEIIKSKNDKRKYKFIKIDNGIEALLISDKELTKSSVALAVNVGSYNEKGGNWGLAHYLEHMLFLGTKKYPEQGSYSQFVSSNGGKNNAYTYMDHTNYMVTIDDPAFEELLDRFSDYFKSPLLSKEYIDKERHAVHSEWSMKGVYDGVILGHLNGLTLNPQHPVANFTWGNLTTLKDTEKATLHKTTVDFYNNEYSANRMKVVLISKLSLEQLKELALRHFSTIPERGVKDLSINAPAITKDQTQQLIRYQPKKDLKKLQIKFVIENNLKEFKTKPNYYVSYLLNSQMKGTLVNVLKREGLINNFYAWSDADAFTNAGEFVIDVDLTNTGLKKRDLIINSIFKYINLISLYGVDKKYYKEIKQSLSNAFEHQSKYDPYSYAADLAANMIHYPKKYLLNNAYVYENFNRQHIHNLLSQLTLEQARIFFIDKEQYVSKSISYFDAQYHVEPFSLKQLKAWSMPENDLLLNLPKLNQLMPTSFDIKKDRVNKVPTRFISSLGSVSYLKKSSLFKEPKGKITVNLNNDLSAKSARNQVLSLLVKEALTHKVSSLSSEASVAGMSLNITMDRGLNIVTTGYSDQQTQLVEKAIKVLESLSLTKTVFNQFKALVRSHLVNRKENALYTQAFDYYDQYLSLGNFPIDEQLTVVNTLSLKDFNHFIKKYLANIRINTFAFGNFSNDDVLTLVARLESQLYKNNVVRLTPIFMKKYHQFQKGSKSTINVDAEQPGVALIDAKWDSHTLNKEATAKVLQKIVSPALFKQIRTEEQLGYSVGFYSAVREKQIAYTWYVQTPAISPVAIFERIESFKNAFSSRIADMTNSELALFKTAVLTSLAEPHRNIYEEQYEYYVDWQRGNYDFDSRNKLIEAVKAVNLSDIQSLYQSVLNNEELARIFIQIKGKDFKHEPFIKL